MARKPVTNFADFSEEDESDDALVIEEPTTVATESTVSARVKGTWKMYWGSKVFDFKDGQRYRIPRDLFQYLKKHGNIYDTMA